jgi:hypothetical protein
MPELSQPCLVVLSPKDPFHRPRGDLDSTPQPDDDVLSEGKKRASFDKLSLKRSDVRHEGEETERMVVEWNPADAGFLTEPLSRSAFLP